DYTKAQMDLLVGSIYLDQGDLDSAIPYFQDAVTNFPHTGDAYTSLVTLDNQGVEVNEYQRGLVNYYAQNYLEAIEAFQRYRDQGGEEFADAALYSQALATRDDGSSDATANSEAAIVLWQELIREYPTSSFYIDAWEDIEYTLWAYLDEPQQAAETALTYVAQRPESTQAPDFLFLAGRSFERANLLLEAAEAWARIANEYPTSEKIFLGAYFAGIAHVRLGEWAGAQALFARALVLTQGMKMGNGREFLRGIRVTPDNTATISKDTYNTTVFPVCLLVYIREFQLPQKIVTALNTSVSSRLQIVNKTRKRPLFQLIEQRSIMFFEICHLILPP
ncbi:MAG: tetratricopeptide repeat protein, partial [Dissulfuribacterales bacterium]